MAYHIIAIICYLGDLPATRVQYLYDADRLKCLSSVIRLFINAVAMFSRLYKAAATALPLINESNVSHHVLSMWESTRNSVTEANLWSLFHDSRTCGEHGNRPMVSRSARYSSTLLAAPV